MGKRGIAIDMDGVIVDTMPFHDLAWKFAFSKYGVQLSSERIYLGEGVKGREFIEQVVDENNIDLSKGEKEILYTQKKQHYNEILEIKKVDRIDELIQELKGFDYKLAVVTGSNRQTALYLLEEIDLIKNFDSIITGDDVKSGKPHPEPYSTAMKKLQISPTKGIAIENAPAGIKSAKGAGLFCIAIETSLSSQHLSDADIICSTHQEIIQKFTDEFQYSSGKGSWRF